MMGVCLGLAGTVWAELASERFTLAWRHSVEKVRWAEDYQVAGERLWLREARVRGSGAGMEVPAGALFEGGQWRYAPGLHLDRLRLGRTPEAGDYELCVADRCRPMADWIGPPTAEVAAVEVWACDV
jgi:hypothetical protein